MTSRSPRRLRLARVRACERAGALFSGFMGSDSLAEMLDTSQQELKQVMNGQWWASLTVDRTEVVHSMPERVCVIRQWLTL